MLFGNDPCKTQRTGSARLGTREGAELTPQNMQTSHRPSGIKESSATRKLFFLKGQTLQDMYHVNKTPEMNAKTFLYMYIFVSNTVLSFNRFELKNFIANRSARITAGLFGECMQVMSGS